VVRDRSDTVPAEPEALRAAKRGLRRTTPGPDRATRGKALAPGPASTPGREDGFR